MSLFAGGSVPYLGSSWCLGLLRDILCCSFTGCRCSAPAPGAAGLAGLLSFLSFLACLCSLPVLRFLLVSWFVVGYTLLCSSVGCRCSVPSPGAAALAGLLSFASVYGRFGVVASSWIWGAFCTFGPAVCLAPAGFLTMAWRC